MKNILVLFGGASSEHDISDISAMSVIKNIPQDKYNVITVGITKYGEWFLFEGDAELIPDDKWLHGKCTPALLSPDRRTHGILVFSRGTVKSVYVDAVFPVLHGKNGEDGTVQGLLELSGIPFVGCDMTASDCCMDKALTNAIADFHGIPQAKWDVMTASRFKEDPDALKTVAGKLGYPIFVKPACAGSSVGITKAHNEKELIEAAGLAFENDRKAVFEQAIDGKEVECAVLGNDELMTGVPGSIEMKTEFYDFDAKYKDPSSVLHIPADIDKKKADEVCEFSKKAYEALGCRGMARVDCFVEKGTGKILLNEINTIPGFTSISMYPKMMGKAGISFPELTDRLITLALEKD